MLGLLWSPAALRRPVTDLIDVDAAEWHRVEAIRAQGRGVVFLTLHFGDWETTGLATARLGVPVTTVMETSRNAQLDARLAQLRAGTGNTIIPQRGAAMKLYRALRRGECVAALIDLHAQPRLGGVWLDFFGKPVFNNAAVAGLALRTGAPIVLALGHPLGQTGRVRLEYRQLPAPAPSGDKEADITALSQACLRESERIIRATPELWLWSYKRWKRSPTADLTGFPFYTRPLRPHGLRRRARHR